MFFGMLPRLPSPPALKPHRDLVLLQVSPLSQLHAVLRSQVFANSKSMIPDHTLFLDELGVLFVWNLGGICGP